MITERTWKRICYSIIAVLVPGLVAVGLHSWSDLNTTVVTVLAYAAMVVWLTLIWRPRRAS